MKLTLTDETHDGINRYWLRFTSPWIGSNNRPTTYGACAPKAGGSEPSERRALASALRTLAKEIERGGS